MRELVSLTAPKGGQLTKKAQSAFWNRRQWYADATYENQRSIPESTNTRHSIRRPVHCTAHSCASKALARPALPSITILNQRCRSFAASLTVVLASENGIDSPPAFSSVSRPSLVQQSICKELERCSQCLALH